MSQPTASGSRVKTILAISGSLRERSSNTAVIRAAAGLSLAGIAVSVYEGLGHLPLFNPDWEEAGPPEPVLDFRARVASADGLLICSPEYARGVSGVLKNGLDWLVGSLDFPGKPTAVVNASPRAKDADAALKLTLRTMSANLIEDACSVLPVMGRGLDAEGLVADNDLRSVLESALLALAGAFEG